MNFKPALALLTYFEDKYTEKYGVGPQVNKIRDKWNMKDLHEEYGTRQIKKLIDLYLVSYSSSQHSLQFFYNNYEKLIEQQRIRDLDAKRRKALLQATRKRVKSEQ